MFKLLVGLLEYSYSYSVLWRKWPMELDASACASVQMASNLLQVWLGVEASVVVGLGRPQVVSSAVGTWNHHHCRC